MYVLNANHISKSYKTAGETMRILQNVNLQVMKGEMVAIMGPSGSGKTTLLHVLTGVDTPDDGEIGILLSMTRMKIVTVAPVFTSVA